MAKENFKTPPVRAGRKGMTALAVSVLLASSGCTRKIYVPVERVEHDTVNRVREVTDSVIERDSVFISVRGDTVTREIYRLRTRTRLRRDTIFRTTRDTVRVVSEVAEPRARTKAKIADLAAGAGRFMRGALLGALILGATLLLLKFTRNNRHI